MFCPKCGEKNENEAKFCKRCGASLKGDAPIDPQKEELKATQNECKTNTTSKENVLSRKDKARQTSFFVLSILSLLFFVLVLGLLFSNYVSLKMEAPGAREILRYNLGPIDLLFNIWNNVSGPQKGDALSAQVLSIKNVVDASTLFAITLVGFVAIAALSILGIYKETKGLIEKKDPKTDKLLFFILITTTFMVSLLQGALVSSLSRLYGVEASFGAGPLTILILGVPLLLAKTICRLLFGYKKEERLSFASKVCLSFALFVTVMLLTNFKDSFAINNQTTQNFGFGSLFSHRMDVLSSFSSEKITAKEVNVMVGTLMAFLFARYALAALFFVYSFLFVQNLWKDKNGKNLIICPSIMLAISVLLTISLPIENAVLPTIIHGYGSSETLQIGNALPGLIGGSLLLLGVGIASYLLKEYSFKKGEITR